MSDGYDKTARSPWRFTGVHSAHFMNRADTSAIPTAELLPDEMLVRWRPLADEDLVWRPGQTAIGLPPSMSILAVEVGDHTWVLPWSALYAPHVANLRLGGRPVLVSVCGVCSSGRAFVAEVDSERLTFQVVGRWNGASLIADTMTWSAWTGVTGEAISGSLKGTRLTPLPLYQSTWDAWRALDPNCMIGTLTTTQTEQTPKLLRPYLPNYFRQTLLCPLDERLPKNSLVLGIQINGAARCYTLAALDRAGMCLNDHLDGEEIVIFHLPGSWTATTYFRRIGEQVISFEAMDGDVKDRDSGSVWNFRGEAMAGPRTGAHLVRVESAVQEWYIWAAYHPGTEIVL